MPPTPPPLAERAAVDALHVVRDRDRGTGLRRHLPYGTVADPIFASGDPTDTPDFTRIVGYDHAGDAAIWTGHYLAAEAFRYRVTGSAAARRNLQGALDGLDALASVASGGKPGGGPLARFFLPRDSPFMPGIRAIEGRHRFYPGAVRGEPVEWIGNTSRDQYSGVFFGLAVAYDLLDAAADAPARAQAADVVTRLLAYLLATGGTVIMPDGRVSTTFIARPDQQLALLQVGRRVNPARFEEAYTRHRKRLAGAVPVPIAAECTDPHGSYYKFNLDHVNLYTLARLEAPTSSYRKTYLKAFAVLRACTGSHQNAHFDVIERALLGPNEARDARAAEYLGRWLRRQRRNFAVDLSGKYAACGDNRACDPVPVEERPNTDFLWQRSPFLLAAGGAGTVAAPGIDYILPYWMGRYYGMALD
jgi:hypothetical protein